MNQERFRKIANFVKDLKDADLEEDKNDPEKGGAWKRKIQSANQSVEIPVGDAGTAGYSDRDLRKIKTKITDLVEQYSMDKEEVLRTTGAY